MSSVARLGALGLLLASCLLLRPAVRSLRSASRGAAAPGEDGLWLLAVWAALLRAGLPVVAGLEQAGRVASPALQSFAEALAGHLLGGPGVDDGPGSPPQPGGDLLAEASALARHSLDSGHDLAALLGDLLDEGRARQAAAAATAVRSAQVWVLLPLGLCFLPAYVLLGVVPAVLGLVGATR